MQAGELADDLCALVERAADLSRDALDRASANLALPGNRQGRTARAVLPHGPRPRSSNYPAVGATTLRNSTSCDLDHVDRWKAVAASPVRGAELSHLTNALSPPGPGRV